jgi:hypothetical protein
MGIAIHLAETEAAIEVEFFEFVGVLQWCMQSSDIW